MDLLYCYKIVFGLVNANFCDFFALSTTTNTRGHKYNCLSLTSNIDRSFSLTIINVWNALPSTVNFTYLKVLGIESKRLIF